MPDLGKDVIDAAKALNPLQRISDVADKVKGAVASTAEDLKAAVMPESTTPLASAQNQTPPQPSPAPTPQSPVAPDEYGVHDAINAKTTRSQQIQDNVNYLKSLDPVARARKLKQIGMDPAQFDSYAGLTGDQATAPAAAKEQIADLEEKDPYLHLLKKIKPFLDVGQEIAPYIAPAGEAVGAARTAGKLLPFALSQFAKNALVVKAGGITGEGSVKLLEHYDPNAGWGTKLAVQILGNIIGGAGMGGTLEGTNAWLKGAAEDHPEVAAQISHTSDMLDHPAGYKEGPTSIEPEIVVGPSGPGSKSNTAKNVTPYQKPTINENQPELAQKFNNEVGPAQRPRKLVSAAKLAKQVAKKTKEDLPAETATDTVYDTGDAAAEKAKGETPGITGMSRGSISDKPTAQAQAIRNATIARQGALAEKIGIEDNEAVVNSVIGRDPAKPFTDQQKGILLQAQDVSTKNILKLASASVKAEADKDPQMASDVQDLMTHEAAKYHHLQNALGLQDDDVSKLAAQAAVNAKEAARHIVSFTGNGAAKVAKTKKFLGLSKYLDPARAGVASQLWSPRLWGGKALTDVIWLPYQHGLEGLAKIASLHPEDALHLWNAGIRGTSGAVKDAFRYAGKSFMTGNPEAARMLGILRPGEEEAHVWGSDYSDTNGGVANQALASTFANANVIGKVSKALDFGAGLGQRVVLSEDQFAKTFEWRAAARSAAMNRAFQDANEKGLWFADRWKFANQRAEEYMNEMPKWLVDEAASNTMRRTFTNTNTTAGALQHIANLATLPSTRYTPELHIGRLAGLFMNTPMNMMKEGMLNSPLAPIVPTFWHEVAGETATLDSARYALTKMAVGSFIGYTLFEHAGELRVTGDGPTDPHRLEMMKEMGWKPRSVLIGNHWVSYHHLGPISTMVSFAVNAAENYAATPDANKGQWASILATTLGQTLAHAPLMYQMGAFFDSLEELKHGNERPVRNFLENMADAVNPLSQKALAEALDPAVRNAQTAMQRLNEDNPLKRAGVPLKRDHWGYPMFIPPGYQGVEVPPSRLEAFLYGVNPLEVMPFHTPDPVDVEIFRVGADMSDAPAAFVGRAQGEGLFNDPNSPKLGVPYSKDEVENEKRRDRVRELAGHEIKISGMNQHDYIANQMKQPYYQRLGDPGKRMVIESTHHMFMESTKPEMIKTYKDLMPSLVNRANTKAAAIMGGSIGAP